MWQSTWILILTMVNISIGSDILMITMGGTKSHKIPFWELARGVIARNHSVTFISAFPADFHMQGLEEISPAGLVFYIRNFTNRDLVGSRIKGEDPFTIPDTIKYGYESCVSMYEDHEIKDFIASGRRYDLIILDGAYPDCAYGLVHHFNVPFMYINTVGFHMISLTLSGTPTIYSVTPFLNRPFTDDMSLSQRTENLLYYVATRLIRYYLLEFHLMDILKKNFGSDIPHVEEMAKNVSFILQNGHYSLTYPRPYLPNVAEIGCIHCKPSKPLDKDLEEFINQGGDSGFIFVSMGSSVKTSNMPEKLRKLFITTFARLPYQILWKWEDDKEMSDLPHNVMLRKWLPQQDLLGHKKIRAFVTHGGLLSMFETVYHGVPIVTMPVFCDHESNAAKAELDGYAIKLELQGLTADSLIKAINMIIHDPKYRENIKKKHILLKDQSETPLDRAVYWVEYVIRHNGAKHLFSQGRNLGFIQYHSIDVLFIMLTTILLFLCFSIWLIKSVLRYFVEHIRMPTKSKVD